MRGEGGGVITIYSSTSIDARYVYTYRLCYMTSCFNVYTVVLNCGILQGLQSGSRPFGYCLKQDV